jgi:hypothetical protein
MLVSYQAAHSMPFMKNKVSQTAYIMVPASIKEKFTLSVLVSFVIPILEMIAVLLLTELTMWIFTQEFIVSRSIIEVGGAFLHFLSLAMNENVLSNVTGTWLSWFVAAMILSFIMSHAWFMCSASLFRKHPFLIGYIIMYVISQIFGMIFLFVTVGNINDVESYSGAQGMAFMSNLWIVYSIASAIMIIPLYYFAYRRMARAQL